MKNYSILLIILIMLVSSCDNDDTIPLPEEPEPTVYEYVYTGKHEIKDFNVYVGPKGERLDVDNKLASNFWGEYSALGRPYHDTIIINKVKDSLYFKSEYFTIDFPLQLSNDTLKYYHNDFEYWGVFQNETTFIMNRAHYFVNYEGRKTDYCEVSQIGFYGYWRYHENARMDEFFSENGRLRSLKDMTLLSDTIAWLTEYYEFKMIRKY